ncbi:hypothetical protein LTR85_003935 [Meristemomyces frigidus]|nr:hypothetical protein LTR85_003935 [Meristemomyces frigidus]
MSTTPPGSPGHSPGGSPEHSPRDPARTLQPLTTQSPDDNARHLSPSGLMPPPPSRSPLSGSPQPMATDSLIDRSASPAGLMPPPPPSPSRQRMTRNSIPVSPGGSEYPAAAASHPVHYPDLRDALASLGDDSGVAGLPSPTRRPMSAQNSSESYSERLAEVYGSLNGTNPFASEAESSAAGEARRGRDPVGDFTLFSEDAPQDGQLDGAAMYPQLDELSDILARTSVSASESAQGTSSSTDAQRELELDIQPTTSEMTIMRNAAETAQLARAEPIRPGLQQTVTHDTAGTAATDAPSVADTAQTPLGGTGQTSYPTFAGPAGRRCHVTCRANVWTARRELGQRIPCKD